MTKILSTVSSLSLSLSLSPNFSLPYVCLSALIVCQLCLSDANANANAKANAYANANAI